MLYLSGAPVTDAGLASLAGWTDLEWLTVVRARVRGPGLRHLAGMKALTHLRLSGNPLEPGWTEHLPPLPALEDL